MRRIGIFLDQKKVNGNFYSVFDIMVNFEGKVQPYQYISDAGYRWKRICDPSNDDLNGGIGNEDLDLFDVLNIIVEGKNVIISTHPHRWMSNPFSSLLRLYFFIFIKNVAKFVLLVPLFNKIYKKYYKIARRI